MLQVIQRRILMSRPLLASFGQLVGISQPLRPVIQIPGVILKGLLIRFVMLKIYLAPDSPQGRRVLGAGRISIFGFKLLAPHPQRVLTGILSARGPNNTPATTY